MSLLTNANVAWMSDSPTNCTGFATISKEVVSYLTAKNYYTTYYLAHNIHTQPLKRIEFKDDKPFEVSGYIQGSGTQQYCRDVMEEFLKREKIDVFSILLDSFMLKGNPNDNWFQQADLSPAKTIFYFPSDGKHFPLNCESVLRKVDLPIAMSKYAQRQVKEEHGIDADYIPHMTDTERFFDLGEEKQKEIKLKWKLNGKFIFGSVFRNQGRKMPDRLIKAWAKFAKDKDDVVLFLHCDPFDSAAPNDLFNLIKRYNVQNSVVFSGMKFWHGVPYERMNEIYNLFDVFVLQTSGEGWGVPTIEAMSASRPVIVTDFTTTQEIVMDNGQCGLAASTLGTYDDAVCGSWDVGRGITSIEDLSECMNTLYKNSDLRKQFGTVGRKKVETFYSHQAVLPEWDKRIKRLLQ